MICDTDCDPHPSLSQLKVIRYDSTKSFATPLPELKSLFSVLEYLSHCFQILIPFSSKEAKTTCRGVGCAENSYR